jgi:hypothetical protein
MLNLKDVLECKRVMGYNGAVIEYTTGLNTVYLRTEDVLYVMQSIHSNEFGYLQTMEDLVYLLEKHNCLSKSLMTYDHVIIADYLYLNNIDIELVIKLCEKVKANKFKQFLTEARDIINKYGLYVPEPKMKHYDRRRNNEKNLAETFDLNALANCAYRSGLYEDSLYIDIANAVSQIVFNNDLESIRYNLNMLYDDYLSDFITDYEYDLMAYCCKVISYMMKYSDIAVYGMEIFTRGALEVALKDFDKNKYKNKERSVVETIFDKAMYKENSLEYNEERMMPKRQVMDEDVEDFKRYL